MRPKILVAVLLGGLCICIATVIPIPPVKKDVIGRWVGFTPDANHFYRMDLHMTNGMIGACLIDSEVVIYQINDWTLDPKGIIKISASAASSNRYEIILSGRATSSRMEIQVSPKEGGWTHKLSFYREGMIEEQLNGLKTVMDKPNVKGAVPSTDTK